MTPTVTDPRRRRAGVGLLVLLLAGCSGAGTDDVAPPSATTSSAPQPMADQSASSAAAEPGSPAGEGVPDGRWSRVATESDARAAGVPAAESELGPDGRLPLVLQLDGDRWTLLGQFQPGRWEAGDLGTLTYEDGRLVITSESEGCPGCVSDVTWTREGDALEFHRLTGPSVVGIDRFIWLGRWQRS